MNNEGCQHRGALLTYERTLYGGQRRGKEATGLISGWITWLSLGKWERGPERKWPADIPFPATCALAQLQQMDATAMHVETVPLLKGSQKGSNVLSHSFHLVLMMPGSVGAAHRCETLKQHGRKYQTIHHLLPIERFFSFFQGHNSSTPAPGWCAVTVVGLTHAGRGDSHGWRPCVLFF